jgi:hypothetical protein
MNMWEDGTPTRTHAPPPPASPQRDATRFEEWASSWDFFLSCMTRRNVNSHAGRWNALT